MHGLCLSHEGTSSTSRPTHRVVAYMFVCSPVGFALTFLNTRMCVRLCVKVDVGFLLVLALFVEPIHVQISIPHTHVFICIYVDIDWLKMVSVNPQNLRCKVTRITPFRYKPIFLWDYKRFVSRFIFIPNEWSIIATNAFPCKHRNLWVQVYDLIVILIILIE